MSNNKLSEIIDLKKTQIEILKKKISIEEYNNHCKKTVMKYTSLWNELPEKMG